MTVNFAICTDQLISILKSNLTPDAVPLIILLDFQLVMVDVFNSIVSFAVADSWMVDNWSSNQALTTGEDDLTAKRRVESRGRKCILPKLNLGKFSRKKTVAKCFVRFSKTSSAIKRFDFSIISVWLLNVVFQLAFFLPPKIRTCQFFVYFQASSVSNICLSDFIFPPKNLEKYRRPKYACADFFFFVVMNIKI